MQRVWFSRQSVCNSGGQDKGRSTSSGSQRDAGAPDHHKSSFKVQTSDQRKKMHAWMHFLFFFFKADRRFTWSGGASYVATDLDQKYPFAESKSAASIFHHRTSSSLAITAASFRTFSLTHLSLLMEQIQPPQVSEETACGRGKY